jgi:hypothetical protein
MFRERIRMGPDDLIDYWSALDGQTVQPDDRSVLPPGPFAIDLQPLPWNGSLRDALVYILRLNPGWDHRDYEYEQRREFREGLRQNLLGRGPYLYLLNRFADHPGSIWARRLFGSDLAEAHAGRICVVQLVPYHACSGKPASTVAPRLPSSKRAVQFLHSWLLPRARAAEIGLVVGRATAEWGVDDQDEAEFIVVYRGSERRGALQTRSTRGGQMIRKFLLE